MRCHAANSASSEYSACIYLSFLCVCTCVCVFMSQASGAFVMMCSSFALNFSSLSPIFRLTGLFGWSSRDPIKITLNAQLPRRFCSRTKFVKWKHFNGFTYIPRVGMEESEQIREREKSLGKFQLFIHIQWIEAITVECLDKILSTNSNPFST